MKIYLTIFGKPRYLGLVKIDEKKVKDTNLAVVKTSRGYEMGVLGGALSDEQQEKYKNETSKFENIADAMLQNVGFVKAADDIDIEAYYKCRRAEEDALKLSRKILEEHKLNMKLVDVEYMLDRKKFYFYFTASQRVDFRLYVRDLAHAFRTRIEMRQVGIRDEARIVRGISTCGRPCCCSYWLRGFSFEPHENLRALRKIDVLYVLRERFLLGDLVKASGAWRENQNRAGNLRS